MLTLSKQEVFAFSATRIVIFDPLSAQATFSELGPAASSTSPKTWLDVSWKRNFGTDYQPFGYGTQLTAISTQYDDGNTSNHSQFQYFGDKLSWSVNYQQTQFAESVRKLVFAVRHNAGSLGIERLEIWNPQALGRKARISN